MELVDWDHAVRTARQLVRPGPQLTVGAAADVVVELRAVAVDALGHVSAFTGLHPDPALVTGTVVVDRGQWAEQNVQGMRTILEPVITRLAEKRPAHGPGADVVQAVGRKVTGTELGAVVAFLASKVLGQYETFLPPGAGDGRLSLVAPNIVEAERRLGVDPHDFRLWVALHEQTHHLQFTGVPWMHEHLLGIVGRLAEAADIDPSQLVGRLKEAVGQLRGGTGERPGGILSVLQTPAQRALAADAQAFMTVLEGHADYVMDAVGPEVVPTVATIRARFEQRRRRSGSPVEALLRRLLGFDAKMAQYRVGGAFFRAVDEQAGPAAVAAVWSGPDALPTPAELEDPAAWLRRTAVRT